MLARLLALSLVLSLLGCAPRPPAIREPASATRSAPLQAAESSSAIAQAPAVQSGFAGTWHTSYGTMRLAQDGTRVHGTYSYSRGSTIEGEVEGDVLRGTYAEPDGTRGRV